MLLNDLRFGWRMLVRRPVMFGVSVAVCAGVIGATTTGFGLVNELLSAPTRHIDARGLFRLEWRLLLDGSPFTTSTVSREDVTRWRSSSMVSGMAGMVHSGKDNVVHLTGALTPEWVQGAFATRNFFSVLGVVPTQGRAWGPDEDEHSVIVTDAFWRRQLGADSTVVGQTLHLNGAAYTIVGVLPRGLVAGNPQGAVQGPSVEVWLPEPTARPPVRYDEVFVRTATVVPRPRIEAELERLSGEGVGDPSIRLVSIDAPRRAQLAPLLRIIGIVGLAALLVACASLASLQLGVMPLRRREMAVRVTLGGGRWVLVRQLLVEGLLLGVIGSGLGVLAASWGVAGLSSLGGGILGVNRVSFDARVFAFAALVTATTVIVSSLPAALQAGHLDPMPLLRDGDRSSSGRGTQAVGRWMVTAQLALACVVTFGAVVSVRSGSALGRIDVGIDTTGVVAMDLYRAAGEDSSGSVRFYSEVRDALRDAGIERVALTSSVPFRPRDYVTAGWRRRIVDENYFAIVGLRPTTGRGFEASDRQAGEPLGVINETLRRQQFASVSPLGQVLDGFRVIGVVEDARHRGLDQERTAVMYTWFFQTPDTRMSVLASDARRGPAAVADVARNVISRMAPEQPIGAVATLQTILQALGPVQRLGMTLRLLVGLAAAAVALALTGLYGVLMQFVLLQRREMTIRLALGALAPDIAALIVRRAAWSVAPALAAGVLAAPALVHLLGIPTFGEEPAPAVTALLSIALVAATVLPVMLLPVRRVGRINPAAVLRPD